MAHATKLVVVLHVQMDITVHAVAIVVDQAASNVRTIITVTSANLDIGEAIVQHVVAMVV